MQFYVSPLPENIVYNAPRPFITLKKSDWDDFGHKTSYDVFFHSEEMGIVELGRIRILQYNQNTTTTPNDFSRLNDEYCSIGVNLDFYSKLMSTSKDRFIEVLDSLNDLTVHGELLQKFIQQPGLQDSLFRTDKISEKLFDIKGFIENNFYSERTTDFRVKINTKGFDRSHEINFSFGELDSKGIIPHRLTALIGSNGSGKTQVLINLARHFANMSEGECEFSPNNPYFSRVIALTYSVFDNFPESRSSSGTSYLYCGIKSSGNTLSTEKISLRVSAAIRVIFELGREDFWISSLSKFLDEEIVEQIKEFYKSVKDFAAAEKMPHNPARHLSSGQNILLLVFTDLIANIEAKSLVLVDELETHLHPNAILGVTDLLIEILETYDSYGVVATHSPLILQNIPSKCVRVFSTEGRNPIVRSLGVESFGEDLTSIINDVFRLSGISHTVEDRFQKLSKEYPYEEVDNLFNRKLSLNSRSLLASFYLTEE